MWFFTIKRVVGAACLAGAYLAKRSLDRQLRLAAKYEDVFREAGPLVSHAILSEIDLPDDDVSLTDPVVTRDTLPRIVRQSVDAIRAEIGWVREDALGANRLVVERCFRKFAEGRGMRPRHIARFAGIVAEVYFIPTADDVLAKAVRAHPLAAAAREHYAEVAVPAIGWELRLWRAGARCVRSALRLGAEAVLERTLLERGEEPAQPWPRPVQPVVLAAPDGPGLEAVINPV